jgi:hypothetical protein
VVEPISVNLPRLGNVECKACGAPSGVHQGTCSVAWRHDFQQAENDIERARVKRRYRDLCERYGYPMEDITK